MRRGPAAVAGVLLLGGAAPAAASISGVCPDGSIFIVQREADIPCERAKQVAPDEVPPVRPEYLPRPYAWEKFHARQDPNNPYNVIDETEPAREAGVPPKPPPPDGAAPQPRPGRPVASTQPPVSSAGFAAAPPARSPEGPGPPPLAAEERRDLALLIELAEQRRPARFEGEGPSGSLRVRLAHSQAFESRLHGHLAGSAPAPGPVVLFSAEALDPAAFHGQLTFVQGHRAFHPEPGDARQLAALDGQLGELAPGQRVVGYAVLPDGFDLSDPLDIYWHDRRIVSTLR